MKSSALRQVSLYALSLGIAACGAGDGSAPSLPTSPEVVRPSGVAAPDSSTEIWMPVGFEGAEPPNFKAVFRVRPKPDTEGIIRGESPLTVEFDVCGSRSDPDKTLTYLYDWDFDHRPNVVGTGDACRQEHTYNLQRLPFSRGNVYETNVCVVSGNPRVHGPGTYFSCRTFRISLPAPVQPTTFLHHTGYGQTWTDGVPTRTYNLAQATRACQEYVLANPGAGPCGTTDCTCGGFPNECTYSSGYSHVWFYAGEFIGTTTTPDFLDAQAQSLADFFCYKGGLVWD